MFLKVPEFWPKKLSFIFDQLRIVGMELSPTFSFSSKTIYVDQYLVCLIDRRRHITFPEISAKYSCPEWCKFSTAFSRKDIMAYLHFLAFRDEDGCDLLLSCTYVPGLNFWCLECVFHHILQFFIFSYLTKNHWLFVYPLLIIT